MSRDEGQRHRRQFLKVLGLSTVTLEAVRRFGPPAVRSGERTEHGSTEHPPTDDGTADRRIHLTVSERAGRRVVSPPLVAADRGETVRLTVTNGGRSDHRLTVDATGFATELGPGETLTASFPVHGPGVFPVEIPTASDPVAGQFVVVPTAEARVPRYGARTCRFVESQNASETPPVAAAVEGESVTFDSVGAAVDGDLTVGQNGDELCAEADGCSSLTVDADTPGIFSLTVPERTAGQFVVFPRASVFSRIESIEPRRVTVSVGGPDTERGTTTLFSAHDETVSLIVHNDGTDTRTVEVPAFDERTAVEPGTSASVSITPDARDSFAIVADNGDGAVAQLAILR